MGLFGGKSNQKGWMSDKEARQKAEQAHRKAAFKAAKKKQIDHRELLKRQQDARQRAR